MAEIIIATTARFGHYPKKDIKGPNLSLSNKLAWLESQENVCERYICNKCGLQHISENQYYERGFSTTKEVSVLRKRLQYYERG